MNEQELLIIGARVRLAAIEAEAAELRTLLNGAASTPVEGSHLIPDATPPKKKLHWRQDPANAEKAAAATRKQRASMRRRRREEAQR